MALGFAPDFPHYGQSAYAYNSSCYHFTPSIYGAHRSSDGAITELNISPVLPVTKNPGFYCPWFGAAADARTTVPGSGRQQSEHFCSADSGNAGNLKLDFYPATMSASGAKSGGAMPQTQPPKASVSAVRFVGALLLFIGGAQVYWGYGWFIDGIPERWIGTFVLGFGMVMEIAPEPFRRRVGRIYQKAEELSKGSPSEPS